MLRKLLLISFLFCFLFTTAQTDQDSAWIRENYTKERNYIPMRDGIKLFTAVYSPKDKSEKHPILMIRTPYSCAPYGADFSGRLLSQSLEILLPGKLYYRFTGCKRQMDE